MQRKERSEWHMADTIPLDGLDRSKKEVAEKRVQNKERSGRMVCAFFVAAILRSDNDAC